MPNGDHAHLLDFDRRTTARVHQLPIRGSLPARNARTLQNNTRHRRQRHHEYTPRLAPICIFSLVLLRHLHPGCLMAAGASTDATVAPQTQSELPVDSMNAPQTANGSGIDSASNAGEKRSQEPGASWRAGEQQVLPQNRLFIVVFALMLTTFLAALDQVCPYFALSFSICITWATHEFYVIRPLWRLHFQRL